MYLYVCGGSSTSLLCLMLYWQVSFPASSARMLAIAPIGIVLNGTGTACAGSHVGNTLLPLTLEVVRTLPRCTCRQTKGIGQDTACLAT